MRARSAGIAAAALLALLPGAPAGATEAAAPAKPSHVSVAILPYLSYAALFIADAEGFFAQESLDVEEITMTRTAAAVSSLVQGDIDVLPGHIGPAYLNAIARGADIRFVADKGHEGAECPSRKILARRELIESGRLTDPSSLRGLRVSAEVGQPSQYYISRVLSKGHLTLDDVTTVDLPAPSRLDAFSKGQLDVANESEPWLTLELRRGDVVAWTAADDPEPGYQAAVVLFGPRLLRRDPEVGKRFLIAYLRGARQLALGKTDRNVEILAKRTGLDREIILAICWPQVRADGMINSESVMEYEKWALAEGLIDRIVKPEEFWDPRFAEGAARALDDRARGGR